MNENNSNSLPIVEEEKLDRYFEEALGLVDMNIDTTSLVPIMSIRWDLPAQQAGDILRRAAAIRAQQ